MVEDKEVPFVERMENYSFWRPTCPLGFLYFRSLNGNERSPDVPDENFVRRSYQSDVFATCRHMFRTAR